MPITCGVPQGSILGPLLFLCYVNAMTIAKKCKLLLYADDSILLASDKDPKAIAEKLSRNLDTCNDWLVDNRLSLHLGKPEAMICSTKQKVKKQRVFTVKCRDTTIKTTTEVKYLGVNLDNTLSGGV